MLMHKTSIARRTRTCSTSFALGLATLGATLAAPVTAWAAACVVVDEQRDGLDEEERQAAKTLFEEALSENGVEVAREGCTETWTLYHVRLGKTVTVVVQGPRGTRRERVKTVEDLPAVYSQLTRAIVTGTENTTESNNVDRRNVTEAQTETRRVAADAIWYAKLGYGATPANELNSGPAFGFGRRWELDRIGIDLSFLNFLLYQTSNGIDGTSVGWVELGVDYFFSPYANNSLFMGAGLSLGSHALPSDEGEEYTGGGLQGKVTLGYELFRASTIRLLVEADARLPFHRLSRDRFEPVTGASVRDHTYAPTFVLSLGIGWGGRSNR
jgi:hypothetical protein